MFKYCLTSIHHLIEKWYFEGIGVAAFTGKYKKLSVIWEVWFASNFINYCSISIHAWVLLWSDTYLFHRSQ